MTFAKAYKLSLKTQYRIPAIYLSGCAKYEYNQLDVNNGCAVIVELVSMARGNGGG